VKVATLTLLFCAACKSPQNPALEQPDAVASRQAPAATLRELDSRDVQWRQVLRDGDVEAAAERFDAVHPKPDTPALRFVRARMAEQLGDWTKVVALTSGLAEQLPEVRQRVEELDTRGRLRAGADLELATRLAGSKRFEEVTLGIEGLITLRRFDEANGAVERALSKYADASSSRKARLRALRAQLREQSGDRAGAQIDFRWLALEATTQAVASGADDKLTELGAPALTKAERLARAEAFTAKGRLDDVQRELRLLEAAPGAPVAPVSITRTLAWAYYKSRKDYVRASELFTECAREDASHRTQDQFYAARALSRAQRDPEAIVLYEKLARRSPTSGFAEEAIFLAARLRYYLGQWDASVKAYGRYLSKYRRGRFAARAAEERAIANLARGRGDLAQPELERQVDKATSDRQKAAMLQLLGVALQLRGQKERAAETFRSVVQSRPLSLSALMAMARLRQLEAPGPPLIAPSDAEAAAPRLDVALPPTVAWLSNLGLEFDAEAELQKREAQLRAEHAPRGGEALCIAYSQLDVATRRYRHAQKVVRERALLRAPSPATEWLWDCIYPRPHASLVGAAASKHHIDPSLVYAVMRQESAFAPRVVSPVGAVGLMQLMPATARNAASELDIDLARLRLDAPVFNVELGSYYLSRLLRAFDGYAPLAVASYNAGPGAVKRWLATAKGLPLDLFVARIPYSETREYVRRVMGNWARYAYLEAGEEGIAPLSLELPGISASAPDY